MITQRDIRRVVAGASRYERPVLSLYMNVNPAGRDRSPKALATRAKSTLDRMPVPDPIAERVVDKLASGVPRGRTAAIFADASRIEIFLLAVEIPVEDPASGHAESRWGEPYVTPLLIALDENEHYGVVHVDRDHVRMFEASFRAVEELSHESRLKKPAELETEQESRRFGRPYVPVRGDASEQLANEHVDELSRLFYIGVIHAIRDCFRERELSRWILAGPVEDTYGLERELPPELQDRLVLRLPSFTCRRAPESEVAERLAEPLARLREEREAALLHRTAEEGLSGRDESLYALQEGRLQSLLVPWPLDVTVYRDRDSGYCFTEDVRPGLEELSLSDALADLSVRFGTKLEFVLGEQRSRLLAELGGLAGIRRW